MILYIAADIYDEVDTQLEEHGLVCECVGGGKILHNLTQTTIEVFGKSQVSMRPLVSSNGL